MSPITSRQMSRGTRQTSPQARPAVESLEERALLDAAAYVGHLYSELLHRNGSPGEVAGWVSILNGGASGEQVAGAIASSTEFRTRVVSEDYQRLLGRLPEAGGLNAWVSRLAAGLTPDQLEAAIVGSDEYFQHNGNTVAGFLSAAYRDELGRGPDGGGLAFWTARLGAGGNRQEAANALANGPEHHDHRVEQDYEEILQRTPDDSGRNFWRSQLDQGMSDIDLLVRLAGSSENGQHDQFEVEPGRRGGGGGADDLSGHH
jgi:hypothetical protein